MVNYLLDTTIIIDYLRGKHETVAFITRVFSQGASFGCCPINIIEVYAGMRENEREATGGFLDSLEYYQLTSDTARMAGEFKGAHRKNGISLSLPDVAIAAVAMANNLTLLTDNPKHYPMRELKVQVLKT